MRLNRYLAASGFGSRRACEDLVRAGKVSVNGHFIRELATQVAEGDDVRVAGKRARRPPEPTVIAFHKPRGLLCTRSDERSRQTIYDALPKPMARLFPVGRLDRDSEGLLLLTDDGELAQALLRPRHEVEKEYDVLLDGPLDPSAAPRLLRGFVIEGGRARMVRVAAHGERGAAVVLTQGLKRQIRQMFFRVGREVERLRRVRIGTVRLGGLPSGHWRALDKAEIAALRRCASIGS